MSGLAGQSGSVPACRSGMRVGDVLHMTRTWIIWDKGIIQLLSRQLYSCYEYDKWSHGVCIPKTKAGIRSLIITPELLPTPEVFLSTNEVVGKNRQALK